MRWFIGKCFLPLEKSAHELYASLVMGSLWVALSISICAALSIGDQSDATFTSRGPMLRLRDAIRCQCPLRDCVQNLQKCIVLGVCVKCKPPHYGKRGARLYKRRAITS